MENSTKHFDIIVIGNGIAARCLLWNIAKLNKSLRVLRVYDDQAYPSCTTRTTSVVSMDVHKKGISELGDILVDAHLAFQEFVDSNGPDGIFKGQQFYVYDESMDDRKKQQYESRYGSELVEVLGAKGIFKDSYLINPEALLQFMDSRITNSNLDITTLTSRVSSVKDKKILTDHGEYSFKNLLLASSAYTKFFYQNENLPAGKAVSGSYYIWHNINLDDFFSKSTVLSKGHFNIIYRRETHELLFGGTSKEGFIFEDHLEELRKEYTKLKAYFSGIDFPNISEAEVYTGIRHKGKKRMPFAGKVDEGVYALTSLYKNGFSFPFLGAGNIVKSLDF
jgi:hypothetical protein